MNIRIDCGEAGCAAGKCGTAGCLPSKTQAAFMAHASGERVDFQVEIISVNGQMAVCTEEYPVYITKEQAMKFFNLQPVGDGMKTQEQIIHLALDHAAEVWEDKHGKTWVTLGPAGMESFAAACVEPAT